MRPQNDHQSSTDTTSTHSRLTPLTCCCAQVACGPYSRATRSCLALQRTKHYHAKWARGGPEGGGARGAELKGRFGHVLFEDSLCQEMESSALRFVFVTEEKRPGKHSFVKFSSSLITIIISIMIIFPVLPFSCPLSFLFFFPARSSFPKSLIICHDSYTLFGFITRILPPFRHGEYLFRMAIAERSDMAVLFLSISFLPQYLEWSLFPSCLTIFFPRHSPWMHIHTPYQSHRYFPTRFHFST